MQNKPHTLINSICLHRIRNNFHCTSYTQYSWWLFQHRFIELEWGKNNNNQLMHDDFMHMARSPPSVPCSTSLQPPCPGQSIETYVRMCNRYENCLVFYYWLAAVSQASNLIVCAVCHSSRCHSPTVRRLLPSVRWGCEFYVCERNAIMKCKNWKFNRIARATLVGTHSFVFQ